MIYTAPGQQPDDLALLERDGLLTRQYDEHGEHVVISKPDDLRVIALTLNARCQRIGIAPIFKGLDEHFDASIPRS